MLLVLNTQLKKGALFLRANFLSYVLLFEFVSYFSCYNNIGISLQSHKSDLNCGVLNLTS